MTMIKDVINTFAAVAVEIVVCDWRGQHTKWRTADGLCPIQVWTGSYDYYETIAVNRGLGYAQVSAVMTWADTGKWPTTPTP